jgi:hypothetical protein
MAHTFTFADGKTYDLLDVNQVYGIVEKLAKSTIDSVKSSNRLDFLNKGKIDNGTIIEDVMIELAESYTYNSNATDVFAKLVPSMKVQYFQDWSAGQWEATIEDFKIRKIISGQKTVSDIASEMLASLTNGADHEDYKTFKNLLKSVVDDSTLTECGTITATSTITDILEAIRNAVESFSFVNSQYVVANYETSCSLDDIRIVIPYAWMNKIDITTLANMFNMEKASLMAKIVKIDTSDDIIYIFDEKAFGAYTRMDELTSAYNAKGHYTNYYLTRDKLYYFSPLFKATYLNCSDFVGARYDVVFTVDDGTLPIANALIKILDVEILTDASGNATFNLHNGEYVYRIKKALFDDEYGTITIASASTTEAVSMTLS